MTTDRVFLAEMAGYGLAAVETHFCMPDHRSLLQQFATQLNDVAPQFPEPDRFLTFWRREIDAVHSVRVAHRHNAGPHRMASRGWDCDDQLGDNAPRFR